jgi:hypothetical protein
MGRMYQRKTGKTRLILRSGISKDEVDCAAIPLRRALPRRRSEA